jgi:hypothetical protein
MPTAVDSTIKELRQGELEEMMATTTLEQLKERAFNPPGDQRFENRIECLPYLIDLQDRENDSVVAKRGRDGDGGRQGRKCSKV